MEGIEAGLWNSSFTREKEQGRQALRILSTLCFHPTCSSMSTSGEERRMIFRRIGGVPIFIRLFRMKGKASEMRRNH